MEDLIIYEGNWPSNVNKDAKYSIKSPEGEYEVCIQYQTQDGEKWYASTDAHSPLVEMVNKVKIAVNGTPGGPFYINEYRQVIVPAGKPVTYYYAGDYEGNLIFDFEGYRLSGEPYDLSGGPLSPGSRWEGPHAGIPYKLKAQGRDISFEKEIRPRVTKEIYLSSCVDEERAQRLAAKIRSIIGFNGGRFYINEFRQLFTGMPYRYIGSLETDDPWFPRPHSRGM